MFSQILWNYQKSPEQFGIQRSVFIRWSLFWRSHSYHSINPVNTSNRIAILYVKSTFFCMNTWLSTSRHHSILKYENADRSVFKYCSAYRCMYVCMLYVCAWPFAFITDALYIKNATRAELSLPSVVSRFDRSQDVSQTPVMTRTVQ